MKLSKDDSALSTPIGGNDVTLSQNVVRIEQGAHLEGKHTVQNVALQLHSLELKIT